MRSSTAVETSLLHSRRAAYPCRTHAAKLRSDLSLLRRGGTSLKMKFGRAVRLPLVVVGIFGVLALVTSSVSAQPYDPTMYQEMRWRMIGPFRGGRTVAISGIPGH